MSSNKGLKVILSKVAWCGHCKDFLPVFNESKNLIKNNKTLKNINIDFEVYDMEEDKGIFKTKYEELVDKVEGYPTVFLAQLKNDKISKTVEIGHAQNPDAFIKLIDDAFKDFSKLTGGDTKENSKKESILIDDLYKKKYLKYKTKYLNLKKQYGGEIIYKLIINNDYNIGKRKKYINCNRILGPPCKSEYWIEISDILITIDLHANFMFYGSEKYKEEKDSLLRNFNIIWKKLPKIKRIEYDFGTYLFDNLLPIFKKNFCVNRIIRGLENHSNNIYLWAVGKNEFKEHIDKIKEDDDKNKYDTENLDFINYLLNLTYNKLILKAKKKLCILDKETIDKNFKPLLNLLCKINT